MHDWRLSNRYVRLRILKVKKYITDNEKINNEKIHLINEKSIGLIKNK